MSKEANQNTIKVVEMSLCNLERLCYLVNRWSPGDEPAWPGQPHSGETEDLHHGGDQDLPEVVQLELWFP